jgi:ATP-dependent Clp protease ATP-binding subunit ClpA
MLETGEIDYLLQATRSSVKRYGGQGPSLSHLAEVVSDKWGIQFVEVFGEAGPRSIKALLKKQSFIGDEGDVEALLKSAEDRKAVLVGLEARLREAIDAAIAAPEAEAPTPASDDKVADGKSKSDDDDSSGWPARTRPYVETVEPRDDLLERKEAVDQIVSTLSRSRHRIPIVLGAKGTGRSTLMAAVGARFAANDHGGTWRVDPSLLGPDPAAPLNRVIEDCPPEAVLVIDDVDKIASLGSARPNGQVLSVLGAAANMPGRRLILICDSRHFSKLDLYAEDLVRELEPVRLAPLSDAGLHEIVERVQPDLESHHGVSISPELRAMACVPPRSNDISAHPGLAVDRLDAAASRACVLGDPEADILHLASVNATRKTPLRATELLSQLRQQVSGQDHVLEVISSRLALTLARLDLRPSRPDGVFLFVGPTGVGKTTLARALSLCLFGTEEKLIRLDMSEYAQEWAVSRLVGPMPGYVGSTEPESWLTTRVSQASDCVLLLDEVEKAHPVVWNTFLQVFDAGRLTDSRGLTADFANTIIVMTSNLGAASAAGPPLGFGAASAGVDHVRQKIMGAVKERMAPELINRIDEIVVFDPLSPEAIEQIAEHELASVVERLASNGWAVSYDPKVVHHIAQTGYDPAYGARHLQRNIERAFLSLVASSDVKKVRVAVSEGRLTLKSVRKHPSKARGN